MAEFETKFGRVLIERSEKENAVNVGFAGEWGDGFASLHIGKRELLRAAGVIGAVSALRRLGKRRKSASRAQKLSARAEKTALAMLGKHDRKKK